MCPLLAQLKIGFFYFVFAAAVYRTNEANKAGLKHSIFLDVYGLSTVAFAGSLTEKIAIVHAP
jgi:hypothetical protein